MLNRIVAYVRGILTRRRVHHEVDEELAFHLEHEINAGIARGLSPTEARRIAIVSLGGVVQTREAVHEARAVWLDTLWRDLRHAVRSLRSARSFSIVALFVLTLGIGATTAIFSVVDAAILRRLPFPAPNRLVAVGEFNLREPATTGQNLVALVAPQNYIDWRAQQNVFTGIAAVGYAGVSLKPEGGREPETLQAQAVTAEFFSVLGVAPMIGRSFDRSNEVEGNARVVVISYGLWQRRFGGSLDVLGQYLPGQLADFHIVGVMPPTFAYPVGAARPTEVWLPNVFRPEDRVRANDFSYRLQVIGRLRSDVSVQQAQAQMDEITRRLAAETPRWFEDRVATVEPLHDYLTKGARSWMLLLLGSVTFVLLLACVNLSNLTLARASTRTRELVVRSALGASRWDLARALLMESLLLSLAGAALGVCAAWLGVELLRAAMPPDIPRVADIVVDLRVLGVAVLMATATGVMVSAVPMLRFSRPAGGSTLTLTGRANTPRASEQWLRGSMVVAEVSLAVVLLVGSGLFLTSFARVANVHLGLDPRDVLTVRIRPYVGAWNWEQAQQQNRGLLQDVLDRVRAIPGVEVAAFVSGGVPLRGDLRTADLAIPGRVLPKGEDLDLNQISPDYFRAVRVPLLKGRFFDDGDREGSQRVVIINEVAAKRYFPNDDPIGKPIQFEGPRTIIGVVGNIRHDGPESEWRRQGFVPIWQSREVGATLVLRLNRSVPDVLPTVKATIWSVFPAVPLPDVQTLEQYVGSLTQQRRFNMLVIGLFGLLGVVIALVGLYGVMAYVVTQRTQEIGIRMALGAVPSAILTSVLGRASLYLSTGLLIGLAASWGLSSFVESFLFQVEPQEPSVYLSVGLLLVTTGLAAAFVPARRAARIDPLVALRME